MEWLTVGEGAGLSQWQSIQVPISFLEKPFHWSKSVLKAPENGHSLRIPNGNLCFARLWWSAPDPQKVAVTGCDHFARQVGCKHYPGVLPSLRPDMKRAGNGGGCPVPRFKDVAESCIQGGLALEVK
jgi:hypothetical protein